jgi:hypothetical protein
MGPVMREMNQNEAIALFIQRQRTLTTYCFHCHYTQLCHKIKSPKKSNKTSICRKCVMCNGNKMAVKIVAWYLISLYNCFIRKAYKLHVMLCSITVILECQSWYNIHGLQLLE